MKLTKIIATIGPSCESESIVEKLIEKGVNIFRFNFKHNTPAWHDEKIRMVKKVATKLNMPIGILIDLQGPEIRINMKYDEIRIAEGNEYSFGPNKDITITHPEIYSHLTPGQKIIADDGAFHFTLLKKGKNLFLKSHSDGVLKNKKTLNVPGGDFPLSLLVDRDLEGIVLAEKHKVDFIALSFVRTAEDIKFLRDQLNKLKVKAKIVAKIETQKAIDNLEKIIEVSDSVMVARGDLGVEFPSEKVPYYQKKIIRLCIQKGVSVITATQMLESMIENPYPTRAEISDVANAVYDLTDTVMLSGETAEGKYPVKTVSVMNKTVSFSEKVSEEDVRIHHSFDLENQTALLCDAAYNLYFQSKDKGTIHAYVVFTQTGRTAQTLSRYRPHIPIYAFTPVKSVVTGLTANFGIYPFLSPFPPSNKQEVRREDVKKCVEFLKDKKLLSKDQKVIALYGDIWGKVGGLTTIRIITV